MIYLLAALLLWLLIIVSFGIYKSGLPRKVKMITFPLLIAFAWLTSYHYTESLGSPIQHEPEGKWDYVHHAAYADTIELWAYKDDYSRLYVFPATDEIREQLEKAQSMIGEGLVAEGEFTKPKDSNGGESQSDMLTIVVRPPNTIVKYDD